jgi:hypothetical protein
MKRDLTMKLIQVTSPVGAVSLLNIQQIKRVTPFADGTGCDVQMLGDDENVIYKVGHGYKRFLETLQEAGVAIYFP